MQEFSCELFEKDIKTMGYKELAAWIVACRNVVQREQFNSADDYLESVSRFCLEWSEHYRQNTSTYKSDKFNMALSYIRFIARQKYRLDCGDFKQDISCCDLSEENIGYRSILSELQDDFSAEHRAIAKIFKKENRSTYKAELDELIKNRLFTIDRYQVRVFDDRGQWIKAATMSEFVNKCKEQKYHPVVKPQKLHSSYQAGLAEYGVTRSAYADFVSENNCEQEFGKKFFINLGFALNLNYTNLSRLLLFNGYSLDPENSARKFDIVCGIAFQIGFSREYTIALIEKWNRELSRKYSAKYKPIPTLEVMSKK